MTTRSSRAAARQAVYDFTHRLDRRSPDTDPDSSNEAGPRSPSSASGRTTSWSTCSLVEWPNRVKLGTREASLAILTTAAGE